jgi:hypothetical protein
MHVRNKSIHFNFQEHHQSTTHVLPHLWIIISRKMEKILEVKNNLSVIHLNQKMYNFKLNSLIQTILYL